MNKVILNNGLKMPQLGYGVYKVTESETYDSVMTAIKSGYRAIDTAQYYFNEAEVGRAIKDCGVPREELFITTKVWNSHQGADKVIEAFEGSMAKLGLDYLDLYLIHWPAPKLDKYVETFKAMEGLYKAGRVKSIGVSNFHIEHLQRLLDECEVKPVINQVECHPYLPQAELKAFCKENEIQFECWSPLFRGGRVLGEKVVQDLAEKYGKSPAQIVLRWHIEEGSVIIPKSVTPSRIKENIDVFDFSLTADEVAAITALETGERIGSNPIDMNVSTL